MAGLHFELVSPAKLLFSGDVDSVVIPGSEGEMTILVQHAPVLTSLRAGVLVVSSGKGSERIFVRGGFAEVNPKGLTVLAERAIPVAEMTDEDKAALAG
jgi:F-type H+-transporting ATPase subunit epsilon